MSSAFAKLFRHPPNRNSRYLGIYAIHDFGHMPSTRLSLIPFHVYMFLVYSLTQNAYNAMALVLENFTFHGMLPSLKMVSIGYAHKCDICMIINIYIWFIKRNWITIITLEAPSNPNNSFPKSSDPQAFTG